MNLLCICFVHCNNKCVRISDSREETKTEYIHIKTKGDNRLLIILLT